MVLVTLAFALPGLDSIGKVVVFLIALSVLIVLHEAGHFVVARLNGVRVTDFAVGFGPTLLKWTSPRSGTNYRLNALPLGGYCLMQGEDGKTNEADQQRAFRAGREYESDNFQAKTTWQRLAIIVAGPVANFVLAFAILLFGALLFGVASPTSWSTLIGAVRPDTPAAKAGLQFGDRIVAIDGVPYTDGSQMVKKIQASAGVRLSLTYERDGVRTTISIVPMLGTITEDRVTKKVGQIGFARVPNYVRTGPVEGVKLAAADVWDGVVGNLAGLVDLVTHPVQRSAGLSGVIGMGRAATEVQDVGWGPYLQLVAMISIALGVFNLLPVPALDGGRAIFIVAEMLRGRPVDPEREALVHFTGFVVLMVLMVFVAYHDVASIASGKGVL